MTLNEKARSADTAIYWIIRAIEEAQDLLRSPILFEHESKYAKTMKIPFSLSNHRHIQSLERIKEKISGSFDNQEREMKEYLDKKIQEGI